MYVEIFEIYPFCGFKGTRVVLELSLSVVCAVLLWPQNNEPMSIKFGV